MSVKAQRNDVTAEFGPFSFRAEQRHEFDKGVVEIRRYFWSHGVEGTTPAVHDAVVLNMAITSRPAHTKVDRVEAYGRPTGSDAGRLLVMIPGACYHVSAPSGAFRSLHCSLHCSEFERLFGETIDWGSLSQLGGELSPGTEIERLMTRIYDELVRERIGQAAVIESCATTLCVELLRRFRQGRPRRPDVHAGGLPAWRMRLLMERVHADMPAPSVTELSDLCGLTTRQLSRVFKAETGMTIGRYVDEATMERAHRLLTSTELTIAAIARELGFANSDSFSQSYRRITGVPPSRSRHR